MLLRDGQFPLLYQPVDLEGPGLGQGHGNTNLGAALERATRACAAAATTTAMQRIGRSVLPTPPSLPARQRRKKKTPSSVVPNNQAKKVRKKTPLPAPATALALAPATAPNPKSTAAADRLPPICGQPTLTQGGIDFVRRIDFSTPPPTCRTPEANVRMADSDDGLPVATAQPIPERPGSTILQDGFSGLFYYEDNVTGDIHMVPGQELPEKIDEDAPMVPMVPAVPIQQDDAAALCSTKYAHSQD